MKTNELPYEETTFIGLLKITGIGEFLNYSLLYSIIISFFTWWLLLKENVNKMHVLINELSPLLLSTAGTIFGIVIAALAVTISVFYKPALPVMIKTKLLHVYMFPFWKAVTLWGLLIIINLFLIIGVKLEITQVPFIRSDIVVSLVLFIFLYSVFYTIRLSGEVIRLTMQSSQKVE